MTKLNDISGRRFGRWVVQHRSKIKVKDTTHWDCVCDCGRVGAVEKRSLLRGLSKSCGCLRDELARARILERKMMVEQSENANLIERLQKPVMLCTRLSTVNADRREAAKEIIRLQNWIALHRGDTMSLSNEVDTFKVQLDEAESRARELEVQNTCLQEENVAIRSEYKQNLDTLERHEQTLRDNGIDSHTHAVVLVHMLKKENDQLKKQLNERCLTHIDEVLKGTAA